MRASGVAIGSSKLSATELVQTELAMRSAEPIEEDAVERAVEHLKRVCRNSSLEFALKVGSVIIHYCYGGSTESWRARGPKTTSFRRLAERPDLPMSPGALYRCVALFELCDRLDAPSRWRNLGACHLRGVLGLPVEVQEQLLTRANAQRWTVEVLDAEARKHKAKRQPKGGRQARHPLVLGLSRLQHGIESCSETLDHHDDCDLERLQLSASAIAEAQKALDKLARRVSSKIRQSAFPLDQPKPRSDYQRPTQLRVLDQR